jgi:hypothetical protein
VAIRGPAGSCCVGGAGGRGLLEGKPGQPWLLHRSQVLLFLRLFHITAGRLATVLYCPQSEDCFKYTSGYNS